jgi:hypothetical protein
VTTADELADRALALARSGTNTDAAVAELLASSGDRRVAVVLAREHVTERLADLRDPTGTRAMELLDEALRRGSWDIS